MEVEYDKKAIEFLRNLYKTYNARGEYLFNGGSSFKKYISNNSIETENIEDVILKKELKEFLLFWEDNNDAFWFCNYDNGFMEYSGETLEICEMLECLNDKYLKKNKERS